MPLQGRPYIHLDTYLTSLSIARMQAAESFAHMVMFPSVSVAKQSDKYRVWDKDEMWRIQVGDWPNGERPPVANMELSEGGPYFCNVEGLEFNVTDNDRENFDDPGSLDEAAVGMLSQQILMSREAKFISSAFATSIWTSEIDGAASPSSSQLLHWSDSSATPFDDVVDAHRTLQRLIGRPAGMDAVLCVGSDVHDALLKNSGVRALLPDNQPQIVSKEFLALAFGVDKYVVAESVYNSAQSGATATIAAQAGKHALLAFVAKSPSRMAPSAGYMFNWKLFPSDLGSDGAAVEKFSERPQKLVDVYRASHAVDFEVTCADAGYFFNGIVA